MYKNNAKKRRFTREIETAFSEWKYIFLFIFLVILTFNFL